MSPDPEALKRVLILSLMAQPKRLDRFLATTNFEESIWVRYYLLDPALCSQVRGWLEDTRLSWQPFVKTLPMVGYDDCPHPPCPDEMFWRGVMDWYRLGDGRSPRVV